MADARILIAEDESIVALDVRQRLERQGYAVAGVAHSASQAMESAAELRPDLVLMDIVLRGERSGLEAGKWIATELHIPVVYLTAHGDRATIERAKLTNPYGYILKPLKARELEVTVEMTLQRNAVERRLREREQWLAATLGSINDAVITTDRDGAVTFMNPPAEDLTGWRHEDALGRDLSAVLTLADAETGMPHEVSLKAGLTSDGLEQCADCAIVASDGTSTLVDHRLSPIRDQPGGGVQGFVLSFRDISESRQAETALRESEEQYRLLFENMMSGFALHEIVVDDDGEPVDYVFLEVNAAFEQLTGLQADDVVGRRVTEVMPGIEDDPADWVSRYGGVALSGTEARFEQYSQVVGRWFSVLAFSTEPGRFATIFEDVTERRRAQQRLERRVDQLTLLNDIGQRIGATLELDAILNRCTRLLHETSGYHHVALFTLDTEREEAVLRAGSGDGVERVVSGYRQKLSDGIVGWACRHGETLLVNDVDADPRYIRVVPHTEPTRSELAVPVRVRGETIGVLDVQSPERDAFDRGDVMLMEAIAHQLGLAIWRGRLYEAAQRRSERLTVLNAVSSTIFSSLEPETVMEQILRITRRAFGAPEASILLRDRNTGELYFALTTSADEEGNPALEGVRLQSGQGIAGWVVERDRAVRVDDVHGDHRWYSGVDDASGFQTRSLISAPLKRGDEIIGALEIVSNRRAAFNEEDLSLLEGLCAIAAIGLDNARLYAATRSHAERLTLLHQLGQALSATLDYDIVIRSGLAMIRAIFGADAVWFVEPAGRANGARLMAAVTDEAALDQPVPLPVDTGITAWALRHGEPVLVHDVSLDPRFSDQVDRQLGIETRSMMASPLATTDRLLGAIAVSSGQVQAFERGDLNTLQAVAATMSMALENALLYENLKTLLREREETQARLIQSEKMAALGRLLATITHEVNNPLQAIQGCLTLAKEELEGRQRQEKLQRYLKVSGEEIEHIAEIVRRTRAFYRPAIRGSDSVDVHAVLQSVLALTGKELQYSDITVERDWSRDLPEISANGDQLKQVFLNLVLNAVDAMPGGGTLRVRTSLGQMSATGQDGGAPAVRIEFSDTGEGIASDMEGQIFEPFFTTKEDGTGLGLFVAYGAVQAHGGEITATSEADRGTTFTVLLPVGRTES